MESLSLSSVPSWGVAAAAALTAALFLYSYGRRNYGVFKKMGVKGPAPLPFVGNMLEIIQQSVAYVDVDNVKRYGKVHGVYNGSTPILMVADPDLIKEILIKEFQCFLNRTQLPIIQKKPLDRTLSVISDDHWRNTRSRLSPTFSTGKLKQMLGTINLCTESVMAYLDRHEGVAINVKDVLSGYTMDVIAGTAFGLDLKSMENPNSPFPVNAKKFFEIVSLKNPKRLMAITAAFISDRLAEFLERCGISVFDRLTVEYMENVVKNALQQETVGQDRKNFAQLCLSELVEESRLNEHTVKYSSSGLRWTPDGLLLDDIISNSIIFLLAGYDTVATFLSMFCYAMATNPVAQKKAYECIREHVPTSDTNYDNLKDIPYLDMCMDETFRMYPPAMRLDRVCCKDVNIGGINIPAGMSVNVPVYALHHDPEYWPEPDTFRPERFLPEEKAKRHACCYLPFGTGPRNCIGMRLALLESRAALVRILLKYEISTCENTPVPPLKFGAALGFLVPAKPIELKFTRR